MIANSPSLCLHIFSQSPGYPQEPYKFVPPHVEYALTPLGTTLKPVIRALAAWGDEFVFCSPEGRELRISKALGAPAAELQA